MHGLMRQAMETGATAPSLDPTVTRQAAIKDKVAPQVEVQ